VSRPFMLPTTKAHRCTKVRKLHSESLMWPPAHALAELAGVVGLGAVGAGMLKVSCVEGRIALVVGVSLLACCAMLGGFA
jgi:hypothetical protein